MSVFGVSVIIPVYNRYESLKRALDSVLKQRAAVNEIIVVNDGSDGDIAAVCREAGEKIQCIDMEENRGVSAARNRGIEQASHDWIALLDSDDEWLPEKMEDQWRYLEKHPELTILQSEEIWIRHGRRVNPMKKHRKYGGDIFYASLPLCIVSPSAVLFKKDVFQQIGGFDESLAVCEDYDLWLRWSLRHPFGLLESFGIRKFGGHEDQLSRSTANMDRYRIQSLNKLLGDPLLNAEKRSAVLEEMRRKLKIYLGGMRKRGHGDAAVEALQQRYFPEDLSPGDSGPELR